MFKVVADAIISRLLLVILLLMVAGVVGMLLVHAPGTDESKSRVERSLTVP